MSLSEKHHQWMEELKRLRDPQERMSQVIQVGRQSAPFPPSARTDSHLIPGCLAKLWLLAEQQEGRCRFHCDSDSAIVKGVATLLCRFFSDASAEEILAYQGDVLAELGIQDHLSPNRRNGLGKLRQRIRDFAEQQPRVIAPSPVPALYDAHNHLQDPRLGGRQAELIAAAQRAGVARMVVNGSCEEDWPQVKQLADRFPMVLPSFGYHPWYVRERTPNWQTTLLRFLETPGAAVGEVGLDRWIPEPLFEQQEEVFRWQLRLAAERNLPLSIHCLKAWGRLEELLRLEPRPARGFLLHSYGGPVEMVPSLTQLGAYFSFPGYYLHERKARQRETFRHIPPARLLVETDAPDQPLPETLNHHPLADLKTGEPVNHPANLQAVYEGLAAVLTTPLTSLMTQVEQNFRRLFLT